VRPAVQPTGVERFWAEEEIIVSKTDLKGIITYANEVFQRVSGYTEEELIGQNHNIIRHPDMPRAVFKLLWDTLHAKQEIFAYVVNLARNGDCYWVHAHVTPTFGPDGEMIGYHSSRRVPERSAVEKAKGLYAVLLAEERKHSDWREGMQAAGTLLGSLLSDMKVDYDEFVFSL
jgi:PAS domain S-box-containing protein